MARSRLFAKQASNTYLAVMDYSLPCPFDKPVSSPISNRTVDAGEKPAMHVYLSQIPLFMRAHDENGGNYDADREKRYDGPEFGDQIPDRVRRNRTTALYYSLFD